MTEKSASDSCGNCGHPREVHGPETGRCGNTAKDESTAGKGEEQHCSCPLFQEPVRSRR